MSDHSLVREATRRGEELQRGHAEYTGGPKFFHHMGHKREAAYPWLSDVEIAGEVRMLMRNDIVHEAIVCAARDRILHLSEELARLDAALFFFSHGEVHKRLMAKTPENDRQEEFGAIEAEAIARHLARQPE